MTTSIDSLIESARGFATDSLQNAFSEIGFAVGALNGVASISPKKDVISDPADPAAFIPAVPPTLTPLALKEYAEPGAAPTPQPVPDPLDGIGEPPVLAAVAPTYLEPQVPTQLTEFTESAPSIVTDFTFPTVPSALSIGIEVPVMVDKATPVAPQIILPVLDVTAPTDLPTAPTDYVAQFNAQYHQSAPAMYSALEGQISAWLSKMNPQYQSQLSSLQSRLNGYLAGGTALTPAVQDAIYERSKDKNNAEYRRTRDAVFMDAAKRGFTMPNGAIYSAMQQARQASADNNARAATDIGVKIAEMEQQNMQFAVAQVQSLTATTMSAMISYHQWLVAINGQALDAAKTVLSALIETYNSAVRGFEVRLDAYKAEAQVYDAKLRAALSGIELYKSEIAALEALTNVDRTKVEIYKGRIEALNSLAGVFRTEVEAIVSQAGLEKLKLELYGSRVQAYSAMVQAKSAQYQGYSAAVNGEEAKARVFTEQVKANYTQVEAWKARIEGRAEQIRAISINNQALAEQYKAIVGAYETKVRANAQMQSTKIDYGRELIQEYGIANQAAVSAFQAQSDLFRTKTQVAMERGRLEQTDLIENAKISLAKAQAISQAATSMAQILGTLAASSMAGMNTLVSQSAQI